MTGKEYMRQVKKIDTMIKNKNVELRQFREMQLPAGELMQSIDKLHYKKRAIIKNIEELPEAEYDVLHMVYMQGFTLQEVAAEKKISYSLATTIHGRALRRLESMINATE